MFTKELWARGRPMQGPTPAVAWPQRGEAPPGSGPVNFSVAKATRVAGPRNLAGAKGPRCPRLHRN